MTFMFFAIPGPSYTIIKNKTWANGLSNLEKWVRLISSIVLKLTGIKCHNLSDSNKSTVKYREICSIVVCIHEKNMGNASFILMPHCSLIEQKKYLENERMTSFFPEMKLAILSHSDLRNWNFIDTNLHKKL